MTVNKRANRAVLNRLTEHLAAPTNGVRDDGDLPPIAVSEIIQIALRQQLGKFADQQTEHTKELQRIVTAGASSQGIDGTRYLLHLDSMTWQPITPAPPVPPAT